MGLFKNYFFSRGRMIVVLGTDGSGKSTVIDGIMPTLQDVCSLGVVVKHLKPDLLPPLGWFRGVRHEAGYVCRDPHGSRPSGLLGSLFRITYLTVDYILGYWFKVRIHLTKGERSCWIFDRYAYDMLIDPLRFRLKLPSWVIRFYLKFIPRPDMVLCLGGDPVLIDRRKPEIGLAEVSRQVALLKELCASLPQAHWIDTTSSLDETIANACMLVEGAHK